MYEFFETFTNTLVGGVSDGSGFVFLGAVREAWAPRWIGRKTGKHAATGIVRAGRRVAGRSAAPYPSGLIEPGSSRNDLP
jgi:hypothetical protein